MRFERSRSRRAVSSASLEGRRPGRGEAGFTLVEVMVAMLIFLIGSIAVAQLLTITTRMQMQARNATEATRLAQSKFDELLKVDFATNPQIQLTPEGVDSLSANVASYFDVPVAGLMIRRWLVQEGPTPTTRIVTVRIIAGQGSLTERTVEMTTLVRQW